MSICDEVPKIAVIIPTRNRQALLPRAVDSVLTQSEQNLELVIVDDCSEDDTATYLKSISDPRVKWHRFDTWRRGSAARNFAVAMSQAPILSFLDSDDYYLSHRLREVLAAFSSDPSIDLHLSSYKSVSASGTISCVNPDARLAPEALERYLVGYCLFLGGSAISMRRRVFDEIGGFDESLTRMQDRDLLLRVARKRGCLSESSINWVKLQSPDSVSRQATGQISALSALSDRHPTIRGKYQDLFRYLVAREIVHPIVNLRFRRAISALKEAADHSSTRLGLSNLASHYLRGKRYRRRLRRSLIELTAGDDPSASK